MLLQIRLVDLTKLNRSRLHLLGKLAGCLVSQPGDFNVFGEWSVAKDC